MSIILDNAVAIESSAGSPLSWTHVIANQSNLCLIVAFTLPHGATLTGVTYNSVSMNQLTTVTSTVGGFATVSYIYGLLAPATGSNTVAITFTGSLGTAAGGSVSYYNVQQSSLPDSSNTIIVASNNTVTVTTNNSANAIAVAFINAFSGFTGSPAGAGATLLGAIGSTTGLFQSNPLQIASSNSASIAANMTSASQGNGQIVSLFPAPVAYTLTAAVGAYVLTGFNAMIGKLRTLITAVGGFTITGYNATFILKHNSFTQKGKSSDSWGNGTKHSASISNRSKSSSSWSDKPKN